MAFADVDGTPPALSLTDDINSYTSGQARPPPTLSLTGNDGTSGCAAAVNGCPEQSGAPAWQAMVPHAFLWAQGSALPVWHARCRSPNQPHSAACVCPPLCSSALPTPRFHPSLLRAHALLRSRAVTLLSGSTPAHGWHSPASSRCWASPHRQSWARRCKLCTSGRSAAWHQVGRGQRAARGLVSTV